MLLQGSGWYSWAGGGTFWAPFMVSAAQTTQKVTGRVPEGTSWDAEVDVAPGH